MKRLERLPAGRVLQGVLASAWLSIAPAGAGVAEPPRVDFLFPAGGSTNDHHLTVRVGGKLGSSPLSAWCEGPGISFEAAGTNGAYHVTFGTNAVLGPHWVRFFNTNGVSEPRLFDVTNLPERTEDEAPNAPAPPPTESFPVVFNGRLRQPGEIDTWLIRCETNEVVWARLHAVGLDSPLQASLSLVSSDGLLVDASPEPAGRDPSLMGVIEQAGVYRIEVGPALEEGATNNAARGGEAAVYRLVVAKEAWAQGNPAPEADAVVTDPGMLRPQSLSTPLTFPCQINGWIDPPGDEDTYAFAARARMTYFFQARAGSLGSPLKPLIQVLDADHKVVAESPPGDDARLEWVADSDGDYYVKISGRDGTGGPDAYYRFDLDSPRVNITAKLDRHTVVLAAGETTELVVDLVRPEPFDKLLAVLVGGLPSGVSAGPTHVPPTETRARVLLAAGSDVKPSDQPCQIIVTTIEAPPEAVLAKAWVKGRFAADGDLLLNQTEHFWLTVRPK